MQRLLCLLGLTFCGPLWAIRVDTHAHVTHIESAANDPAQIVSAMDNKGITYTFVMATPEPLETSSVENSTAGIVDFIANYPYYQDRFKFFYGGAELNYLIHGAGRMDKVGGANRWTAYTDSSSVYPNGCHDDDCSVYDDPLLTAQDIETHRYDTGLGSIFETFRETAIEAAESGLYLGFGEIGALHYSQRNGHPYVHFPVNHTWMKELSDIAADYCMTIDLHAELQSDNVGDLEDLLDHNTSTNIVLQHVGWSSTGEDQLALLEDLMANHTNLYLALKKCEYDSPGSGSCYVDYSSGSGVADSDWITFVNTYSSRIMIGSDVKYWASGTYTVGEELNFAIRDKDALGDRQGSIKLLMDSISSTARANVEGNTADSLYNLSAPVTCPTYRSARRVRQCSASSPRA